MSGCANSTNSTAARGRTQFQGKNWFLTYPQCSLTKEEGLSLLLRTFDEQYHVLTLIVAEEKHKDGETHLHALMCLQDKLRTRDAKFADIAGFHGNYQTARSVKNTAEYIKKDGNFIVHGVDIVKTSGSTSSAVAKLAMTGATLKEIMDKFPGYMAQNQNKIEYFQRRWMEVNMETKIPLPVINWNMNETSAKIAHWLAMNLWTNGPRPLRTPQIYLYGPHHMGKTYLAETLRKSFNVYSPCPGEKYFDGFDDAHELIIFDEFCGKSQPLSLMKMILDGQEMRLPCRYRSHLKRKNIPVMIISNNSPLSVYRNLSDVHIEAFVDRFISIEILEMIEVFKFNQ